MATHDTHSLYRDGAKWMVSIAGAIVAGAFTQYDKVLLLPFWVKFLFFAAILTFLSITILGVFQYYWLNRASNQESRAADANLGQDQRDAAVKALGEAKAQIKTYHEWLIGCFATATLFSAVTLFGAIFFGRDEPKQPSSIFVGAMADDAPKAALGFEIVQSAVHQTKHGKEAHTLLLNRDTGEVWQMLCDGSTLIQFQKVRRVDTLPAR
jgi:hypothetical protein